MPSSYGPVAVNHQTGVLEYAAGAGGGGDATSITDGLIVNADVNVAAAIAKSKLAALAIVNADVDAAAAIVASKLSGVVTVVGGGKETVQAHGAMGATETFDLANGNLHSGTLDAACTFTFAGSTASVACSLTLILTQDATGGRAITWPASVDWPGGVAPVLSTGANKVSMLTFLTVDNGTIWFGFLVADDLR